jgi:hypothetical protein
MTLDTLEAIIWAQAAHLTSTDPIIRRTAMDAILQAVSGRADTVLATEHRLITKRRRVLAEATSRCRAPVDPAWHDMPLSAPEEWHHELAETP